MSLSVGDPLAFHRDSCVDPLSLYLQSGVAHKDAYSFYARSKAATEQGLADLEYADTIIFRPGFLRNTNRAAFRPIEAVAGCVTPNCSYPLTN